MPQVSNVPENISDHVFIPENDSGLLIIICDNATVCLVLTGRGNPHVVEFFVDTHIAHSLRTPFINHSDNRCCVRIYNQLILVVRGLEITVFLPGTDKFSIFHLTSQSRGNLARDVLCIVVIDDIREGYGQLTIGFYGISIEVVIDCNEADTEERTDLLQELAGLNIISTKTGKVFDHDTVDFLLLDSIHKSLPLRTVKVSAGVAIVRKGLNQSKIGAIGNIAFQ